MGEYGKFWAAVATVIVYLLTQFGIDLPAEVAAAVTTLVVVAGPAVVWAVPNQTKEDAHG